MSSAPAGQHGIFLGNLDNGTPKMRKPKEEVAEMISRLIFEAAGYIVKKLDIHVKTSGNCRCYTAWFCLDSQDNQQKVFMALKNYSTAPDKLVGLVKSGRKLKVDLYKPRKAIAPPLPSSTYPSASNHNTNEAFIDDQFSDTSSVASNHGAVSTPKATCRGSFAASVGLTSPKVTKSTDPSLVVESTTPGATSYAITSGSTSPDPATLGATCVGFYSPEVATPSAGTPKVTSPIGNGNFTFQKMYTKGEELQQNETRVLEFKKAGGCIKWHLKKHLAKFVCAYLNSAGGTLMLGVEDSGIVCGVKCDRKLEDEARCYIDNTIKKFYPSVLPHMYQVQFVPVWNDTGIVRNLKVIEVSVEPGQGESLYETPNGKVFIKCDGSVKGPLRPKEIQEWCKQNDSKKNNLLDQFNNFQARLQKLESDRKADSTKDHKDIKKSNSDQDCTKDQDYVKKTDSDEDSVKNHTSRDIKKTSSTVCSIL